MSCGRCSTDSNSPASNFGVDHSQYFWVGSHFPGQWLLFRRVVTKSMGFTINLDTLKVISALYVCQSQGCQNKSHMVMRSLFFLPLKVRAAKMLCLCLA